MLGHLGVNVSDLDRAKMYYVSLMPLLGFELYRDDPDQFAFRRLGGKPGTYLFFYPALQTSTFSRHQTGLQHLAFIVPTREAVHAIHAKVQDLGSEIVHAPQEFPTISRRLLCDVLARARWHDVRGRVSPPPGSVNRQTDTQCFRRRIGHRKHARYSLALTLIE